MSDLSWREAIVRVLKASPDSMHYTEIAEAIAEQGLKVDVGATPAQSVSATITVSLRNEGAASPFVRVDPGRYWLRSAVQGPQGAPALDDDAAADETNLIGAFGMYWSRANVQWRSTPRLLGRQPRGSTAVDFCEERGVYLLHDRRDVIYVGRATAQPMGVRLLQHTFDRLNGRWERFSWFGVRPVIEGGTLAPTTSGGGDLMALIGAMEAVLIEGLEPPQNRRRGDRLRGFEYIQVEDPELEKSQFLRAIEALKTKL